MVRRRMKADVILTGTSGEVGYVLGRAQGVTRKRGLQVSHKGIDLEIDLVRSNGNASGDVADDLFDDLVQIVKSGGKKVSLEPNCGTSLPFRNSVNPWDWGVNPWDWGVNPWDWGVNPMVPRVIAAGTTPDQGADLFRRQPAFRAIGLNDAAGQRTAALAPYRGAGVLVGVFDTLPDHAVTHPWLTLHPAGTIPEAPDAIPERDLSDHGLIIASLINAVAPEAEVHLYQVCGKDGFGTLFPLLEALASFIALAAGKPAVLNLSLGSLCGGSQSPALQALLQKATDLGMVVCAAAGNMGKSAVKACTLPQAQVPAGFANAIAVAAANAADHRATFSQRGDMAAFGGEDQGDPGPGDAEDITGMGDSPSGYVSMDGGTSFAAPLVAGAAALALADQMARGAQLGPDTYKRVKAALEAGARPPAAASAGDTLETDGLGAGLLYLPAIFGR